MDKLLRLSWIYTLSKDELTTYLMEFDLEGGGTTDELRKRLSSFLSSEHATRHLPRLLELQTKHQVKPTPGNPGTSSPKRGEGVEFQTPPISIPSPQSQTTNTTSTTTNTTSKTNSTTSSPEKRQTGPKPSTAPCGHAEATENFRTIVDTVRKWGIQYNGNTDPFLFLERVEELATVYEMDKNFLPRTMSEFLKDRALIWYRNNNQHWDEWIGFREALLKFFLPSRYFEKLDDEIRRRSQRGRESFKDYSLAMQNLMRQGGYSEEQKLERIFRNADPKYHLYIRRRDFSSLPELLDLAEEYEGIQIYKPNDREYHRMVAEEQPARINVRDACRRCGQSGHFAARCRNPVLLFCWECGRRNIRTIDCCRAGNVQGTH